MNKLIIYNLETDLDSKVLASSHDWIVSFANQIHEVVVYSTHVGRWHLPDNVKVVELSGGTTLNRFLALYRLFVSFFVEIKSKGPIAVFHHMSTRTLLIVGCFYKIFGVKQGLWYSHSKKTLGLQLSAYITDYIFSSTPSALPLSGKKTRFVGHGIRTDKFRNTFLGASSQRSGIVALGRIAPIKNIESAIMGISESSIMKKELTCIGAIDGNKAYVSYLTSLASSKEILLTVKPAISYEEVPQILCRFDSIFTGTPDSVDKAAIEGALCGCFVISDQKATLNLTGMSEVLTDLGISEISVPSLITLIENLDEETKYRLRRKLSQRALELNELEKTTRSILSTLEATK